MRDARGTTMTVRISAPAATGEECTFTASGRTITFPGFLRAYVETVDELEGGRGRRRREPAAAPRAKDESLTADSLDPVGSRDQPAARYTEASLVKTLEERGIGRPSTYASIINTIQDRGYVWKKGSALVPSWIAFAVIGLLEKHFERLVDYDFTAAHGGRARRDRLGRTRSARPGSRTSTSAAGTATCPAAAASRRP